VSAKKCSTKIYCKLVGYGAMCDAHHITTLAPKECGLTAAMEMALKMSGMDKTEVSYINVHGTSTNYNNKLENMAIKMVFEDHAKDGSKFVVSTTKSITGHTLGAVGGLEAVVVTKSILHDVVPPTMNLDMPNPECDLDNVPNKRGK